jgi:hypothetical protein
MPRHVMREANRLRALLKLMCASYLGEMRQVL